MNEHSRRRDEVVISTLRIHFPTPIDHYRIFRNTIINASRRKIVNDDFFERYILRNSRGIETCRLSSALCSQTPGNRYICRVSWYKYRLDHPKRQCVFLGIVEFHIFPRFLPFFCLVALSRIYNGRVLRRWIWWSRHSISRLSTFSSCLVCHSWMVAFSYILVR